MRTKKRRSALPTNLGDYPVMGYFHIGSVAQAQTGLVDTGTRYSVIPHDLADAAGAKPTGKTGRLNILKRTLQGTYARVRISSLDWQCAGETKVFVPNRGQDWGRGLLLGAEFLQDTGMHVNARGEAYCPVRRRK